MDSKPRLKWTSQLHQLFVDAVSQLGGVDKATPKYVMRVMGVPGLTLHHLKSHLQKYRLAKNRESSILRGNRRRDAKVTHQWTSEDATTQDEANEAPPQCETTLKMQMEVQRKLQEQIEVQRHLQLRIEAQGKYLQSVLKKAQEALAGYSSSAIGIEAVRTELSELVSAMDTECLSSSISPGDSSAESCLTCGDVMETKEGNSLKQDDSSSALHRSQESDEFSQKTTKRMQNDVHDDLCRAKRSCRRSSFTIQEELDLNI
ncbi:myb family transcription factor PHL8-like isoform X2 [Musa acuminata AAA Group]|uniref:myb family transcription factor PHL8 isoform X2 n=1 Tax=Musa acuminata AAA Group TaxID=214697 RepID=UPI0031CFE93B